jgi:hypothetical protein
VLGKEVVEPGRGELVGRAEGRRIRIADSPQGVPVRAARRERERPARRDSEQPALRVEDVEEVEEVELVGAAAVEEDEQALRLA